MFDIITKGDIMKKVKIKFELIDGGDYADSFTCEGQLLEQDDLKMLIFTDRDRFVNTITMDPSVITTKREGRFTELLNFRRESLDDGYMDAFGEQIRFKVNTLNMNYDDCKMSITYNLAREGAKNPYKLTVKYVKI